MKASSMMVTQRPRERRSPSLDELDAGVEKLSAHNTSALIFWDRTTVSKDSLSGAPTWIRTCPAYPRNQRQGAGDGQGKAERQRSDGTICASGGISTDFNTVCVRQRRLSYWPRHIGNKSIILLGSAWTSRASPPWPGGSESTIACVLWEIGVGARARTLRCLHSLLTWAVTFCREMKRLCA